MNNTMEYRGYVGSVEFSEADQLLFGKVQGIELQFLNLSRIFTVLLTIISNFVALKGQLLKRLLKVVLTSDSKTLISTNGPQYMHIITT